MSNVSNHGLSVNVMKGISHNPIGSGDVRPGVCRFIAVAALLSPLAVSAGQAADVARTSLFDAERSEPINTWGGPFGQGTSQAITVQSLAEYQGRRAAKIELGKLSPQETRTFQMFASGFTTDPAYRQTRDLGRFEALELAMMNQTAVPLEVAVEVFDYRDSEDHRAVWRFGLVGQREWQHVSIPLTAGAPGWRWIGQPDFSRVSSLRFVVRAKDLPAEGSIFLDDVVLVEPGGPLPADQTPLDVLVERIARRGWDGLWSARSRQHGMIASHSYQVSDAGLNTTAAVLWMLPAAVRRGWVDTGASDAYVAGLLRTLNLLMDQARHLPPRNVDWVTLAPSLLPEESSVDAAFLAMALHQYKSLPTVPDALRAEIDRVENRFAFDAFSSPSGWKMAYRYASSCYGEGFSSLTYDGYTSENKVVSLAAHLSQRHHVDIGEHWNTDVYRVRAKLIDSDFAPAVHSLQQYRAPFTQALLNLFVDVRDRGPDTFPNKDMATNPWQNFVAYQQQVMSRLRDKGRRLLVQPDAGDDGTLANYQQFSLYEDFGQSDLFMPWSVGFTLLAGVDGAEEAFRFLLKHDLHGPLGMVDSARWATGADRPGSVTARHDFWNTALATMAMLEYLEGDDRASRRFAALPEVRGALDRVFPAAGPAMASVENSTSAHGPGDAIRHLDK